MNLLCVVGPTGVGKTAVAIELCELLNGEIVSADSMQIYRGLDIATAKPTREEQARARHHLIDIREPHEPYSAAQWAEDAHAAIKDITQRGKTPIICGGTGFYLRALLQPDILAAAPPDAAVRAQWEQQLQSHDAAWLHAQLEERDSAAAARLHPNDTRRVIRALEVAQHESGNPEGVRSNSTVLPQPNIFGLTMPREQLYARLEARIDSMIGTGFERELRFAARFAADLPSMQGVGYRQMRAALDDKSQWDASVEQWKRDTRRYAKRQMTWFRHQLTTQWLDTIEYDSPRAIAADIVQRFSN
jgi:tRNA dimethylallyltransferase